MTGEHKQAAAQSPFVLVHGAWCGGWCWRGVAEILRNARRIVFTPTLSGLGERRHFMSKSLTLNSWVEELIEQFVAEELDDVILVGHSFGGRVVTGVADRIPDRIRRVIFLDSTLPESGKSLLDQLVERAGEKARAARIELTKSSNGLSLPPPAASYFGVSDPSKQAWVNRRLTPHPFSTNTSVLNFDSPIGGGNPVSYIKFTDPPFSVSGEAHAFADAQEGWDVRSTPTGHMGMVSAAEHVAAMLLSIADQTSASIQGR